MDMLVKQERLKLQYGNRVYKMETYQAERGLSDQYRRICMYQTERTLKQDLLDQLGGTLDEVQMGAVKTAATSNAMILTGGPGTGKTTTTNLIISYFELEGKTVLLAAPTGRAAKRMQEATGREARTIHRLLEVEGGPDGVQFGRDEFNPLEGDVIIIDETSMMDLYLGRSLMRAVPSGAQLILVGDRNQLPSVGPGNVLADIIASGICPVVELKKIYRQAEGSHIIHNAHCILNNKELNITNRSKDFFFKECNDPEEIKDLLLHYVADSLPDFTGESEVQVLAPLRRGCLGVNELNIALQERLNSKQTSVRGFRVGDKVIQTVNDYKKEKLFIEKGKTQCFNVKKETGVFNGDAGRIELIDSEEEYMYVRFEDGALVKYEFKELDSLSLAYALTIHKSQGSEYPVVVIPVWDYIPFLTTMNLLYTGVTRAKKAILLIGSRQRLYQIIRNVRANDRYTALAELLAENWNNKKS